MRSRHTDLLQPGCAAMKNIARKAPSATIQVITCMRSRCSPRSGALATMPHVRMAMNRSRPCGSMTGRPMSEEPSYAERGRAPNLHVGQLRRRRTGELGVDEVRADVRPQFAREG